MTREMAALEMACYRVRIAREWMGNPHNSADTREAARRDYEQALRERNEALVPLMGTPEWDAAVALARREGAA